MLDHYVDLPITDDIPFEGLKLYCQHYNCKATKLNDTHWRVFTDVAANLFWLGINFTATVAGPLTTTPAEMYLTPHGYAKYEKTNKG